MIPIVATVANLVQRKFMEVRLVGVIMRRLAPLRSSAVFLSGQAFPSV